MSYRHFTDTVGQDWTVFDVTPRADDRRSNDRRRNEEIAAANVPESGDGRTADRRVTVNGQRPPRLTKGWLCFERDGERRRLQPVPDQWTAASDAELEKFLESARIATPRLPRQGTRRK